MPVRYSIPRDAEGIKCDCGGYADQVDSTREEARVYGCGSPGCCDRAFVCAICGTRIVGTADAPEME